MSERIKLYHGHQYRFQLRHRVTVLTGTFWYDENGMWFAVPNGEFNGMKQYEVFRPSDCVAIWYATDESVTVPVS